MSSDPDRRPSKKDRIMKRRFKLYRHGGKYRSTDIKA